MYFSGILKKPKFFSSNLVAAKSYKKSHYCFLCKKPQQKLPRHFERQHGENPFVKQVTARDNHSDQLNPNNKEFGRLSAAISYIRERQSTKSEMDRLQVYQSLLLS